MSNYVFELAILVVLEMGRKIFTRWPIGNRSRMDICIKMLSIRLNADGLNEELGLKYYTIDFVEIDSK